MKGHLKSEAKEKVFMSRKRAEMKKYKTKFIAYK